MSTGISQAGAACVVVVRALLAQPPTMQANTRTGGGSGILLR